MGLAVKHQVAVDFVGDAHHSPLAADTAHLCQGLARPLYAHRVVGVAENHHRRMMLLDKALKLLEVHLVVAILGQHQGVGQHLSPVALDDPAERMVDRRLDYDLVTFAGEMVDGVSDSSHHPGDKSKLLAGDVEAVVVGEPLRD